MFVRSLVLLLSMTTTTVVAQQAVAAPFEPIDAVARPDAAPEAADLGRLLFFDPRLSGDSSTSCSECHSPTAGWTDGSDLGRGYPGTKHWRNSQTVVNAALLGTGLHWDATVPSLLHQVHGAMGAGVVFNMDAVLAEERLRQIPEYRKRFHEIWGEEPSKERMAEAIAAFEATLISDDSPFDRYLAGDNKALSASAMRGMDIFTGKANCTSCHNGALLTDGEFHNISVPVNPDFAEDPLRQVTFRYFMRQSGVDAKIYDNLDRDPGRFATSGDPDDLGKLRTPPLRYLKYTAPYMHNGVFYTLEEVVEFYNIGGTQDVFGTKSPLIQPLNLTRAEKQDLVAFLESLSGTEIVVETPESPDYDVLPGPSADGMITAARLRDGGSTATASSGAESEPVSELKIETAGGDSGLALVRRTSEPTAHAAISITTSETAASDAERDDHEIEVKEVTEVSGRFEIISGVRYLTVQSGDTLGTLAVLAYGDDRQFRRIFDANTHLISNPNVLIIGTKLRIPD